MHSDSFAADYEAACDWVRRFCTGDFWERDLATACGIKDQENLSRIMADLIQAGLVDPINGRHGYFAKLDRSCPVIEWKDAPEEWYPMRLPLGIDAMCGVRPKNIIVVAGETNAGKTLFVLQLAHKNLEQHGGAHKEIYYFNSEMGPDELRSRLTILDASASAWNGFHAYERSRNFHAVIKPNGLNIVDYLEISDKFFLVADFISKIHARLDKGVCVICLQKARGRDSGRGGDFTLEKARLGIAISNAFGVNVAKITKCKNPLRADANPQGKEYDYRIVGGARVDALSGWRWVTEKERKQIMQEYERNQASNHDSERITGNQSANRHWGGYVNNEEGE